MASTSTTFNTSPRPDHSSNLAQWVTHKAESSPAHPLFAYDSENCVTWAQVGRAIGRAAKLVDSYFDVSGHIQYHNGTSSLSVGILANLDSITYHILYLGIIRAGGAAFLISTRNSPAAVAHLLRQTGTQRLIVSPDEPIQGLIASALAIAGDVTVQIAPTFKMLFDENDLEVYTASGGLLAHIDSPAITLHSSGSTSFPKIVVMNHRAAFQWARLTDIPGVDVTQHRFAVHAMPVFHGMGLFVLLWAACTGLTLTVFPPQMPPVVPSPETLLTSAVASRSTFMMTVPLFLETWSHDVEAIAQLQTFCGVAYGGGPLKVEVGNKLTRMGVQICSLYGATELGPTSVAAFDPSDNGWVWSTISPRTNPVFIDQGDNTFELHYVACATHRPLVTNTMVEGKDAFATNDIVIRHPKDATKFMLVGRKDSQIMLSSGEKTNPGPIENIVSGNSHVHAAIMFGRGRDQNGILIQPARGYEFDPADMSMLAQFRNSIWPSVEQANAFAPSHSRIYKEMILVTHRSRPIEMTPKHTPRRGPTLEAYKDDIDAAYAAVRDSVQTDVEMPLHWGAEETLEFTRKVVYRVLAREISDDIDIFEQGGDSLQATYIRNTLVRAVRQTRKGAAEHISQNFVYANPTISRLTGALITIVTTSPNALPPNDAHLSRTLREIEELISEMSTNFPAHHPTPSLEPAEGEIVLLTGTTGALGSQLLALLVSSPDVRHVYALNRPAKRGGKSLKQRQVDSFTERGLDICIVDSLKVTFVEGDTAAKNLDISSIIFDEIRDQITLIIHNAWRVNFNLGFGSFKENVMGVRTLVDLALQSPHKLPPRIIYTSSVGVFRNWDPKRDPPLEVRIDDPTLVLGSGYSESKFVGERILESAALATPLRPVIVRIGQLTSTANGAWNSSDWLPAIVRSGQVLGVLPGRSDRIAWISLDMAAQALFDFRHSHSQYLHLAHPNPVPWSTVFDVFSSRLGVDLVSWTEWLSRLEQWSEGGTEKNPAVYLLEFFRGCAPVALENREALGIPLMDMQQALRVSPSLAHPTLSQIGSEDAEGWIRHWTRTGFLSHGMENE